MLLCWGEKLIDLFLIQGLVHMGKGTIGVNPFYNDRQILSPSAISGLLSLLVAFTESKSCEPLSTTARNASLLNL